MNRLLVVTASVRPGRIGPAVAEWVHDVVRADERFELDAVDLVDVGLPFHDEAAHPAQRTYTKPHTIAWSERVSSADAIIVVMPEYNHSFPASLKNAIDFLYHEWFRKPLGFVAYGGPSGGGRSIVALENVTSYLGMVRAQQSVEIAGVRRLIEDGRFLAPEPYPGQLATLLDELAEMAPHLAALQRR